MDADRCIAVIGSYHMGDVIGDVVDDEVDIRVVRPQPTQRRVAARGHRGIDDLRLQQQVVDGLADDLAQPRIGDEYGAEGLVDLRRRVRVAEGGASAAAALSRRQ